MGVFPLDMQMTNLGTADWHAECVGHGTQVRFGVVAGNRLPKGVLAISQA